MSRLAAVLLALALAACKPAAPTLDPSADPIARAFFEEVRTGADVSGDIHVAHELKNPTSEEQLAIFRGMIPPGAPTSVETRSWKIDESPTGTTTRMMHVYHYPDANVIAQTALFKSPSGVDPVIVGFEVSLEPADSGAAPANSG
ncbi:MAG: hypothetical protein ACHP7N_14905 [Caulobacterales bacterium]